MSSQINNQTVAVQKFFIPIGTGIANNTSPSLTPTSGGIAYDRTTPGILYIADGTNWVGTSGSTDNPIFDSITLVTAGGFPTPLDYYETGSFSVIWTGGISKTETFTFVRIGQIVTIRADNMQTAAISGEPVVATGGLPAKLTPTGGIPVTVPVPVLNNSAFPPTPGMLRLGSDSQMSLFLNMSAVAFTATGLCGHGPFSVTYNIN